MVNIIPRNLPLAPAVATNADMIIDNGTAVYKATVNRVVDAGAPIATLSDVTAGVKTRDRVSSSVLKQAIDLNFTLQGQPFVDLAQAWAESPGNPDPSIPGGKSAKTWAGEAADSAGASAPYATYATRTAFLAANVSPVVTRSSFFVNGNTYAVVRDASGPIVQGNGQTWRPDGDAFPEHNGVDPATNTWTEAAPAIVHRGVPEYLTPELYLGLETQLVYAPGQGSPGEYTGATDFGPAFDAMREELLSIGVASQWPAGTNFPASLALRPGHRYITTTPIPLQDIISTGLLFDGQGATVVGRFDSNRAVLDMLGSQLISVQNLRIETDSDLRPAVGVLLGRTSGATAERNDLSRVTVNGWFNQAGIYNYASEILTANRVTVYQYQPDVPAVLLDCMNTLDVATLSPATNTNVVGTDRSMNESLWLSLDARCVQGSQTGVVKMISGYRASSDNILHRHKFVNSYVAQNNSTPGSTADRPAFFMKGDTVGIDIDCHVEPYVDNAQIRVSHNILFNTASGPMYVSDFRLRDHMSDAQKAVIDTNDAANALSLWNAEIDIPRSRGRDTSNVEARLFGPNMTNATVHGVIKTGLGSALNNFNNLADFKGVLRTEAARSAVTLLPAHAVKMVTSDANSEREQLSILSYTTPNAAVVAVAGADVIFVSGGGVSSIAGFSDVSQVRSFRVVNGRGVSITINGLAGTTSRDVPAGQGLTIFQNGGTFYAI